MSERQSDNRNLTDGPFTTWNPRTWPGHNGASHLFYSGQDGPVTSRRTENWLDGMEDHEHLTLARRHSKEARKSRRHKKADKLEHALPPIPGQATKLSAA